MLTLHLRLSYVMLIFLSDCRRSPQLFRSSEDSDIHLLFTTSTALHTDEMIHYR